MEPTSPVYRLIAQNRNDILVFEVVGHSECILRTAADAAVDRTFLAKLSAVDTALIHFIAGPNSMPNSV